MQNKESITRIFNKISPYYDFMNDIISFGYHKIIKRAVVKELNLFDSSINLDLCCGTGDLSKIINYVNKSSKVIGVDNSVNMLKIAKEKNKNVRYIYANAEKLPFPDNYFDNVIIGFGFRNILNREETIKEIYRVLKPEGTFVNLDMRKEAFFNVFYQKYVIFCSKIFKKDENAYKYLIDSIKNYCTVDEIIEMFQNNNFKFIKSKLKAFNMISYQVFKK